MKDKDLQNLETNEEVVSVVEPVEPEATTEPVKPVEPVVDETAVVKAERAFVTGVVNANTYIYKTTDETAPVRVARKGLNVRVSLGESTGDWYRVSTDTGIGGFCKKKFVTAK